MSAVVFFVFLTGLLQTIKSIPTLEADTSLEGDIKLLGEGNNSESTFWNASTILVSTKEKDGFCKGREDGIYPHDASCSQYYRCSSGVTYYYKCVEKFLFDSEKLKCMEEEFAICKDQTKTDLCFQQHNGLFPDYSSGCHQYYRCRDGQTLERQSCPIGQSFSYHLQSCQQEGEATCVQPSCRMGSDGYFILPGSRCQAYYYCSRGVRSDFICPKETIFDRESKTCIDGGICYEPICTGRINGNYPDTTHECRRLFNCKGGHVREVMTCPAGLRYNGRECLPSAFVHCEKPDKTSITLHIQSQDECRGLNDGAHLVPETNCRSYRTCFNGKTVTTEECPKGSRFNGRRCSPKNVTPCDDACTDKSNGYYADDYSNCHNYYYCFRGAITERRHCPDGTSFNGYMCVPSALVTCANKVSSPELCIGLADGFHADYANSCKGYFYCSNHELVLRSSCLEGMAWNGKQCVDQYEFLCKGPELSQDCNGLLPGLYQDKSSNCINYYYCSNGNKTTLSCPKGQIYDGDGCVSTDEYTCPTSDPDVCFNKPDGYRQDENADCRSYYFCSNGNKITYVCPNGFLFNGTSCVAPDMYRCPHASNDCLGKHNGYHADESSTCRKYYYCHNGDKITTIKCRGKKIFNGHRCVLTNDPKMTCANASYNPCRNKKDGNYVNEQSNCTKYFSCEKEIRIHNWECPNGSSFNGEKCVEDFDCESNHCDETRPGFFPDLATNCRNYYFCVGKRKSIFSCPKGHVFNGQRCIQSDKCPSEVLR